MAQGGLQGFPQEPEVGHGHIGFGAFEERTELRLEEAGVPGILGHSREKRHYKMEEAGSGRWKGDRHIPPLCHESETLGLL